MRPIYYAAFLMVCFVATLGLTGLLAARVDAQTGAHATPAPQQQTVPPTPGPVPPRDPRLKPLKTEETSPPPNVTTPPPPSGTPDIPQRPLTADEAVRLAFRLQPDILTARAALYAQRGRTRQARSALQPQVVVTGSYNRVTTLSGAEFGGAASPGGSSTGSSGPTTSVAPATVQSGAGPTALSSGTASTAGSSTTSTPSIGVIPGADLVGTLRQLIFDFNHTRDLIRQSRALERAADQNVTRTIYDVAFDVKQTFYQFYQAVRLEQVAGQEVTNRQAQLDLALSRYNVGLGQPVDVYTAQTAKAEAVLSLTTARDSVEQARIALATIIGIDPRTPIQPDDSGEPPLRGDDVNAMVAQSIKQRPEAIQAREMLTSFQHAVRAARSSNAPIVSGELNVISQGDQLFPQNDYAALGISLSWSPMDGGLTGGRIDEARANVLAAQTELASVVLSIKSDVASAYINVRNTESRVAVAQADVSNAEQNVEVAEARYRTGIGQFVDIINAQAFLLTARQNLVTTLALIPQYRAALAHAIGTRVGP